MAIRNDAGLETYAIFMAAVREFLPFTMGDFFPMICPIILITKITKRRELL